MRTNEKHRQFRSVCHIAASHLEHLGYTVLKTATRSLVFDLVAFNNQHTLFISARRVKKQQTAKDIVHRYHDVLVDMQKTSVPHGVEKQFWIYQPDHEFAVYKLFGTGIMKSQILE
jgi:hypothetical protein